MENVRRLGRYAGLVYDFQHNLIIPGYLSRGLTQLSGEYSGIFRIRIPTHGGESAGRPVACKALDVGGPERSGDVRDERISLPVFRDSRGNLVAQQAWLAGMWMIVVNSGPCVDELELYWATSSTDLRRRPERR